MSDFHTSPNGELPPDSDSDQPHDPDQPRSPDQPSLSDPPLRPAAPSKTAKMLAFLGIVVAGIAGGMAGYAFSDLQCDGNCGLQSALWALGAGFVAAVGVGVVANLTLRAMNEWHSKPS